MPHRTRCSLCTIALSVLLATSAQSTSAAEGPTLTAGGPLAFGPDNVLFVADNGAAKIVALELGAAGTSGTPGTMNVPGIDRQIAALLGTAPDQIRINDLAVNPTSKNAFLSVSRGLGADSTPVLLRVDGAGMLALVSLGELPYTEIALPNAPASNPSARRNPRASSVTDMSFVGDQLFIAGLSSEEFSSKLRAVPYPFAAASSGASVEIWHAAHGRFETHSPVYTFVPYEIGGEQNLIAGYLCTPLVKFPVTTLQPGAKVMGTTIAELGSGNRPIDMVVYKKDGADYLLMSNTSRGVMKIPTSDFDSQPGLTEPVGGGSTAGVAFETIEQLTGIEQLDLLDDQHIVVIARNDAGLANLEALSLP
jgi:hypothetical protein